MTSSRVLGTRIARTWSMKPSRTSISFGTTFLLAGLTAGCDRPDPVPDPVETVDNVADQPYEFFGKKVTLYGEVDDIRGKRVFELEDEMDLIFEDSVLVLTRSPVVFGGSPLADDDEVVVQGTVRKFVSAEIESELEWDLDLEIEVEDYESKPVLVADSVRRVMQDGRWSEKDPKGVRVGLATITLEPEPERLAGTPLTIERVKVRRVQNNTAWVGTALAPVFVVAPESIENLDGKWVDILGTVQPAPTPSKAVTQWKIDPEMTEGLSDVSFYLDASLVEKSLDPPEQDPLVTNLIDYEKFTGDRAKHVGKEVKGTARVTRVISDRAFYLASPAGPEVLALVREDVPQKEMIDIDAGQELEFQARVLSTKDALAGKLEGDAKEAVSKEPAFLDMHWRNVEILSRNDADQPVN